MSYLERLRHRQSGMNGTEKNTQPYKPELTKPTKPPFVSFDSAPDKGTQLFLKSSSLKQPAVTEPLPTPAAANRRSMPITASTVYQFRQVFGADQVRVGYAEENGRKVGTAQPPGVKPSVLQAECRTCLRYDPRGHYCGHKLRVIREGEVLICAGRGYSPKGSPWKEVQT